MKRPPTKLLKKNSLKKSSESGGNTLRVRTDDLHRGKRLDRVLIELLETELGDDAPSRSQITGLIGSGDVLLDGVPATKAGTKLKGPTSIEIRIPDAVPLEVVADASVPFSILFEDEHLLVIDKPAGVVVHPGAGRPHATLVSGILAHLGDEVPRIGDALRPGIVHRLDRETSGVMVVAKSERALRALAAQLRPPRRMSRRYLALSYRLPRSGSGSSVSADGTSGVIERRIGRHPTVRVKMSICRGEQGRAAKTSWRVVEAFANGVLTSVMLHTGRTHQIRVHFASAGAPLVGDPLYGGAPPTPLPQPVRSAVGRFRRQALHASELSFDHPITAERVSFTAPLPSDLASLIETFRCIRTTA